MQIQAPANTEVVLIRELFSRCRNVVRLLVLLPMMGLCTLAEAQDSNLPTVATAGDDVPMKLVPAQHTPIEADFINTHPVLRVAVAGVEYLPYQTIVDGKIGGYSIRFLEAIARANGFRLEYKVYATWGEVLLALENRQADLTPSAGISRDRERYLEFTAGITPDPAGLVGRVSDDRFLSDPTLEGMRVAVGRQFVAESYLKDQFPLSIPVGVESVSDALVQLASGDVDYYYGPLANVYFAPDKELASEVEIKQRVFFSSGWAHIAVRSDWPIVKRLFNRFVGDGRSIANTELVDIVGERMGVTLPRLITTPAEKAFLSGFRELKVGTLKGIPLLNDTDDGGRHTGIASEFTAYLAYQVALPVELVSFESNSQMLEAMEAGQIDLIPYFGITEERKKSLRFSDPYLTIPWMVVGPGDGVLYWDLGSLKGKGLAMREKHPLRALVERRYPEVELMIYDTADESIEAVASGRADAAIETKLYVNRVLSQQYAGDLRILGEVKDDPGHFGFAVSPANALMTAIINKTVATMPDGFTDRVIRRWIAVDFAQEKPIRIWLTILVPTLIMMALLLLAALYWCRRTVGESRLRLEAEQRLVDMTEQLRTGVFQYRQYEGEPPQLEFTNRITRRMARVADDDPEGRSLQFVEFIDAADREFIKARLRHCMKTGEHFRETFRFEFPGGEKGWIVSDAHCREEADGARVWSGYLFDMTSERMLTEELNSLLVARDEFLSMASHELRTPVQNVAMSLELIKADPAPASSGQSIDRAMAACKDLEELVSDIVEMTSMNHHSPVLSREPLNLNELVGLVSKSFYASAARKSIDLSVIPDPTLPEVLLGDTLRIKQVLYNLVGNAIKYTDRGGVSVRIETLAGHQSAEERMVAIVVSDSGLGIADDQLARIFEPFSTVGPASRRSSGLGLALSDRLVAVMGGRIRVTSMLGEGSTFTIELPLPLAAVAVKSSSDDIQPAVPASRRWNDETETLLLVDDNLLVLEGVAAMLQARGWKVYKADSARAALDILQRTTIKALVTDQQMPEMTGIDLAREIHDNQQPGEPRPVLILMSGGMSRENSARAARLFDAMLFKPVKAEQIRSAVDDVISRSQLEELHSGASQSLSVA